MTANRGKGENLVSGADLPNKQCYPLRPAGMNLEVNASLKPITATIA